MSVDVSEIQLGDKVKISLYGLPESDWLEVKGSSPSTASVALLMPDGDLPLFPLEWITAHEPAAPALPEWWGSLVIHAHGLGYYPYDQNEDDYVGVTGISRRPEFFENVDVTVIVDRDGNPPAAARAEAERDEWRERYEAVLVERDRHRADLAEVVNEGIRQKRRAKLARTDLDALRAEVAKVRDGLYADAITNDVAPRGGVLREAADRLSAILDGDDQ